MCYTCYVQCAIPCYSCGASALYLQCVYKLFLLKKGVSFCFSAHAFCAPRKAWFKRHAGAGLTLTQSDQIKFNEPVLKLGTPE